MKCSIASSLLLNLSSQNHGYATESHKEFIYNKITTAITLAIQSHIHHKTVNTKAWKERVHQKEVQLPRSNHLPKGFFNQEKNKGTLGMLYSRKEEINRTGLRNYTFKCDELS